MVITVATNTAASLAQPQIGAAFDVGPADTGWVVFGYSATFAVGTALFGGLAGRFGLVPALVSGVLLLALGSALAVAAPSMEVLIGSRLVQGIGSGAIPTLSVALLARSFDGADRARAIGALVAAVGAGQATGPLLGGVLLEVLGWRAAVSIGIVAAPAVLVLWRSQRGRMEAPSGARLDLIGAALVAVAALGAAFVLNRLPLLGLVPITLVPMVAAVAAGLALWQRSRTRPDAFLPRTVLASPVFRRVTVLGAVGMAAFIGTVVLIPPVASRAYGLSGIGLGLVLLPMAVAAAVSSPNNARVEARLGRRRTTSLSLLALGLGCLTLAGGALTVGLSAMLVALAAIGLGFGLLTAPLLNELTHAFTQADQPVAVGVYNLCFFLGGGLGAAISSALVQAGAELPFIGPNAVPGFATAELLLAVGPLAAAFLSSVRTRSLARGGRVTP
ncbi:MAG: MFS transporter, partial [Candidatus Limnocylindria bacterium]